MAELQEADSGAATVISAHDNNLVPNDYRIALYYCYIPVSNVTHHCAFQTEVCERLSLKGRIRVASEGINGVLSGLTRDLEDYKEALQTELESISPPQSAEPWELDVKFCQLRHDISVSEQLFEHLSVKGAKAVVSLVGTTDSSKPKSKSRRKHKHKNAANDNEEISAARYAEQIYTRGLETQQPAIHLSPQEWEEKLSQLGSTKENESSSSPPRTLLLDCRNVYESSVGHFQVPNADTVLTNTRKFSELPQVLVEQADRLAETDQIFMYCTGGVRCERASVFLQSLLADKAEKQPQVYQLHGGIQRYLETNASEESYYKGKNFVFDPRRTDPVHNNHVVGKCLVCDQPHDDFDNGAAPSENHEARCWNCRILVLVCDECRLKVSCWNEVNEKPRIYCGGVERECFHTPPVQIVSGHQPNH